MRFLTQINIVVIILKLQFVSTIRLASGRIAEGMNEAASKGIFGEIAFPRLSLWIDDTRRRFAEFHNATRATVTRSALNRKKAR